MTFKISSDSTCDLNQEQIKANRLTVFPLAITLGGKEYRDGVDMGIFVYGKKHRLLSLHTRIKTCAFHNKFCGHLCYNDHSHAGGLVRIHNRYRYNGYI